MGLHHAVDTNGGFNECHSADAGDVDVFIGVFGVVRMEGDVIVAL